MYFPYLRCKQFELLALREIAAEIGGRNLISPILEPVKLATAPFEKALDAVIANKINFSIVINPTFGEFVGDASGIALMINSKLAQYANFQIGVILNESTNLDYVSAQLARVENPKPLI